MADELRPWGRFKLVSKDPAEERDHIYFYQSVNKIGRNPARATIVLDMLFISGIHCVVTLEGKTEAGEPIVKLQDLSRNGIYVNEDRIGKSNVAEIHANATLHFTKPGLQAKGISPTVYKFEILKSGFTPENEALREQRDRASARPPAAASASATVTPATAKTGAVAATQVLAGKKQRRFDEHEMVVEVTRNLSSASGDVSPSSAVKRRRTGSAPRVGDDDLLNTTAQFQKSNQALRQKLKEASEREVNLKRSLNDSERDVVTMSAKVLAAEEGKQRLQEELDRKNTRLTDREKQIDRVNYEKAALQSEVEQLKSELEASRAEVTAQAGTITKLQADRAKLEVEMANMTSRFDADQTKIRGLEEQVRAHLNEKKKLEMAIDSVQTRSEQVEEGKRGAHEENIVLKTRLTAAQQFFNSIISLAGRGNRAVEDDTAAIAQELEDLRRHSDNSILSSEQSQPTPVQDNYCADTQPEDGEDEQTLDQEAAAARAELLTAVASSSVGPFTRRTTQIQMNMSISSDLMESDQQPISTDLSAEETSLLSESKSLSEGSSLSTHSSSSKTPPAPPLPRSGLATLSTSTVIQSVEVVAQAQEVVEIDDAEDEKDGAEDETMHEGEHNEPDLDDADVDGDEVEEAIDEDKENTPVADAATPTAAKPQQPGQPGWLQALVTNDSDTADRSEVSASEGGGIFDDETQLSMGD